MRAGGVVALLVVLVLIAGGAMLTWRAAAAPELGAPPRGPDDGHTRLEIAAAMGRKAAQGLALGPHTVVTLSEKDLTTVLRSSISDAQQFQDPEARVRDGLVVIDVRTRLGPMDITAVGQAALSLVCPADGAPDVAADVRSISAGRMPLPGWAMSQVRDRIGRGGLDIHGRRDDRGFAAVRSR